MKALLSTALILISASSAFATSKQDTCSLVTFDYKTNWDGAVGEALQRVGDLQGKIVGERRQPTLEEQKQLQTLNKQLFAAQRLQEAATERAMKECLANPYVQ